MLNMARGGGSSSLIVSTRLPRLFSACGVIVEKMSLDDRDWTCERGAHHDRDLNAAINLERLSRATT
ncbi:MAG: transposase [Chloracidobacterium sp.]|nr:transposase [Chloracidobacterium sp.]